MMPFWQKKKKNMAGLGVKLAYSNVFVFMNFPSHMNKSVSKSPSPYLLRINEYFITSPQGIC